MRSNNGSFFPGLEKVYLILYSELIFLQSFELVDGDKKEDYDKWEQEIEDMLEQEQENGKTAP